MQRAKEETFVELLKQSDIGKDLLSAGTAKKVAARQLLVDEIKRNDEDTSCALLELNKRRAKEFEAFKRAEAVFDAALLNLRRVNFEIQHTETNYTGRKNSLEAQLRDTAAPEIDVFAGEMLNAFYDLQAKHRAFLVTNTRRAKQQFASDNRFGGEQIEAVTNLESILRRREGFRQARHMAEALKLEALYPEEIRARLDAIRAGIPEIDVNPQFPTE